MIERSVYFPALADPDSHFTLDRGDLRPYGVCHD
jgi:hypothetical protein